MYTKKIIEEKDEKNIQAADEYQDRKRHIKTFPDLPPRPTHLPDTAEDDD
jgi:hypothetical protein